MKWSFEELMEPKGELLEIIVVTGNKKMIGELKMEGSFRNTENIGRSLLFRFFWNREWLLLKIMI